MTMIMVIYVVIETILFSIVVLKFWLSDENHNQGTLIPIKILPTRQ